MYLIFVARKPPRDPMLPWKIAGADLNDPEPFQHPHIPQFTVLQSPRRPRRHDWSPHLYSCFGDRIRTASQSAASKPRQHGDGLISKENCSRTRKAFRSHDGGEVTWGGLKEKKFSNLFVLFSLLRELLYMSIYSTNSGGRRGGVRGGGGDEPPLLAAVQKFWRAREVTRSHRHSPSTSHSIIPPVCQRSLLNHCCDAGGGQHGLFICFTVFFFLMSQDVNGSLIV